MAETCKNQLKITGQLKIIEDFYDKTGEQFWISRFYPAPDDAGRDWLIGHWGVKMLITAFLLNIMNTSSPISLKHLGALHCTLLNILAPCIRMLYLKYLLRISILSMVFIRMLMEYVF